MGKGEDILRLRNEGKTYNQIKDELGVCKSLISYYCSLNGKLNTLNRTRKLRQKMHPVTKKIQGFIEAHIVKEKRIIKQQKRLHYIIYQKARHFHQTYLYKKLNPKGGFPMRDCKITTEQVLAKIGDEPKCYLTGVPIDLMKHSTYSLDHIIPASRGGSSELENMGLLTTEANKAKHNMTPQEFWALCKLVVENYHP